MSIDYISGFFDADGSITMSKQSKNSKLKTIKIDFTNTERDILVEIQKYLFKHYDINLFISKKDRNKINHNIGYVLSCSSNQVCYKLCSILKSIHPKKLHRINTVLKYHNLVTKKNGKYTEKEFMKRMAYERLFFSSIFQQRSDYIIIPIS